MTRLNLNKRSTVAAENGQAGESTHNASQADTVLTPRLTLLFSLICASAVATVYFAQPLLDAIATSLHVSSAMIGMVVTITQLGYAAGLLLLVPLGDRYNRKHLVMTQLLFSCAALIAAGVSHRWGTFLSAMMLIGLMAVVVQVVVAFAATLALPGQQGKAVGSVTSGIVLGILLARLIAGIIADLAEWRAVYLSSACLTLLLASILWRMLPATPPSGVKTAYRTLLLSVCRLFITEPALRQRGLFALLIFAAFSLLWTSLVLPLSAQGFSHTHIGFFGLAGIAGALAASKAGRWADRGRGERTTGLALALLTFSWLPIACAESSLLLLILGIIMLDFAVQAVHVTNQSVLFTARPDAQSRMVGAYMFFYSAGSALGAAAATQLYARWGWHAVCLSGATISAAAFLCWSGARK